MADDDGVPFASHLNELRARLIWSLLGVFVVFSVVFALWAGDIVNYVKQIAVVDRDIATETYTSPGVARVMPYRAQGSTWTHRVTQGSKESLRTYTVMDADETESTVRVVTTTPDGKQLATETFKRDFNTSLAPAPLDELDGDAPRISVIEEAVTVTAGEFECFRVTVTDGAAKSQTWISRTGGLVVRASRVAAGVESTAELIQYELVPFREQIELTVIGTLEPFSVTMRVSFYAALIFAYPWIMFQAYRFIAPGLYRRERRFFQVAIPSIFVLFAAGAAFGRYILLPISIPFLLRFNVSEFGVTTMYSLGQFLNLVFTLSFGLGFVFQIPLLVAPLIRFGLLTPEFFKSKRRYTLIGSVFIGALISPTGNPLDMVLAGAPVFFLVEGGVWIGRVWKRAALRKAEREAIAAAERGETFDPEALAGGLAVDLEKRLAEFAKGGARKFARDLMAGFREGGKDVESIFDDDYADDAKPPAEVKLKPRKPKPPAPEPDAQTRKPDQMHDAEFEIETQTAPQEQAPAASDTAWPDRPWDENVEEGMARYIEDRISQRLQQFMETELRPWMERIEHELKRRDGDNQ